MFKLATNPTFTHKVEVLVPVDGGHAKQNFKATFRVMSTDDAAKFDFSDPESNAAFLREVLVSTDDITGEGGDPLPYSDELRDQLIAIPYARTGLAKTYFDGVAKARLGN